MADLTFDEGPCRLGEFSGEVRDRASSRARRGIRDCGRAVPRSLVVSLEMGESSGLRENETSGENGGEDGSAGEESWRGEIGRLRENGGGVEAEKRGEDWLEEAGEIDGEDGPGVRWSVGATDVGADGPADAA